MTRQKVLLVKPWEGSSFIEQDANILEKCFDLTTVVFGWHRLIFILRTVLSRRVDGVVLWFVFWWAFPIVLASRLCGVKTILIPSGIDVGRYPEIEYGELLSFRHRSLVRFVLNNAALVLPVSDFVRREVLKFSRPRRMKVIYNGIDTSKFKPLPSINKEKLVITVGAVNKMNKSYKRFDLFTECAKYLQDVEFVLIGSCLDDTIKSLRSESPSNVSFTGFVPTDDLIQYYRRAKVYAQFSHAEAFGCALAEAMACECVPVVVERGALPEIVGDTGVSAPYDDPGAMAENIRIALGSNKGSKARERVLRLFSLKRRERELVRTLNDMFSEWLNDLATKRANKEEI